MFCGRHARTKCPKIWHQPDTLDACATKIQAQWRGYTIRHLLSLAGPGVLTRKNCQNDDDLVTGEEKDRQNPLQYFGMKDGEHIWWFDLRTMIQWSLENAEITNPYTRKPLSMEDRQRLRELHHYRIRHKIMSIHEPFEFTTEKVISVREHRLVQIMHENGFADMRLEDLQMMHIGEIWIFLNLFLIEMRNLVAEHSGQKYSRRRRYVWWINESLKLYLKNYGNYRVIYRQFLSTLLAILVDAKDPFPYCFAIGSVFTRL